MELNFTDLFVVLALVSAIFGVLVVLWRERQFLTRAVNPYRGLWLFAAIGAISAGISLLRLETGSWHLHDWADLLRKLVTEEKLSALGKAATVSILLGLLFIGLVVWCYFTLPRDPSTFHRPEDRKRAFHYYIAGLSEGLDYALLAWSDGTIVEEAVAPRKVLRMAGHLPRVHSEHSAQRPAVGEERIAEQTRPVETEEERHVRDVEEQIQFWRAAAHKIHESMKALDDSIAPAHQGTNRRLVFDCEFGGLFFIYLRMPEARDTDTEYLYLFAATLNQRNMNERIADHHFALLLEALRHIEHDIRVT
jgi:hypothetical protein